ncbi:MAG: DNA mismatch repair protein MutS [Candidatus Eisenbacteria bacterium]|nr:DNA mismatch repair protein MutS [Candidatus Eisenbacteria bacterium]
MIPTRSCSSYLETKRDHPDAFLFFRMGDFYEMFFEDAVRAAQILGITLTSRNKNDPDPIPMCGFPWHQRDGYVARLLRAGHKVAICDQLEDPAQAKGIVQRGVTEVLTPGSVTSDTFLEGGANNFLGALWPRPDRLGLCLADASTGEMKLAECDWSEAPAVLARTRVAEWLVPEPVEEVVSPKLEAALLGLGGARSRVPVARYLDASRPPSRWSQTVADAHADLPLALAASAAALDYLDRSQGGVAAQMTRVERWSEDAVLRYDAATARHLELFTPQPGGEAAHTLWAHLNVSVTAAGGRRLRSFLERPLASIAAIQARQEAVAAWLAPDSPRVAFRDALRGLPDLERLSARIACGKATPRDLGALRDALLRLPGLQGTLGSGAFAAETRALTAPPALAEKLQRALTDEPPVGARDGGIIRDGFDTLRDSLHELAHSGKQWIADLETRERERSGIPSLKVGYNKVFGFYLEITNSHRDKVPADYERRQTLTNAERYVTPDLKARESEVLGAEDKLKAREQELFTTLREECAVYVATLQTVADALARLDATSSLAEAAARYGWTRPELEDSDRLHAEGVRHPVVERLLPRGEFVANDVRLDAQHRQVVLLTGPNMGGKSTYLRQVALLVLLAQSGSWVPASKAVIGLVDRLFTRVGAADRLGAGQSTFMVEMSETADILRSASSRSLVLLDEIGRGTATYDGLALAWAVTEYLHDATGPRPRTIFATHYHELTQLSEQLPRLANAHVAVKEWGDGVVFLHRIAEGPADRSYGIHVAKLAGLPASVIERAKVVLAELERERTVEELERACKKPRREAAAPAALPLFDMAAPAEHPLADELRKLTPEAMTPLEALQRLAEWKKRYGA